MLVCHKYRAWVLFPAPTPKLPKAISQPLRLSGRAIGMARGLVAGARDKRKMTVGSGEVEEVSVAFVGSYELPMKGGVVNQTAFHSCKLCNNLI